MKKVLFLILMVNLYGKFLVGVGGYDLCKIDNIYHPYDGNCTINANVTDYLKREVFNVNSVSIWITKDFNFRDWFNATSINENIVKKGYTPIFIIYYFRDDISVEYVKKHKNEYFNFLKKCDIYFSKIKGVKYIILNPEYNENGVASWSGWNDIMKRSYKILKNKNRMIGYGVGDFGVYGVTFDYNNFELFDKSFKAVKYFDFIAFQEMRATTRNSQGDILNTPYRSLEFAKYLHNKYKKPTFLAYLAISSYNFPLQSKVFKRYAELLPIFKSEAGLIGFNLFHLFDQPQQVGYFKQAEKYFGIIDKNGNKKRSYFWFLEVR